MASAIRAQGGHVLLDSPVERIDVEDGRVTGVLAAGIEYGPSAVISSLPLRDTVRMISPPAPPEVLEAAEGLRYRDFLTVALVVDGEDLFPDNWIYIHEPDVRVGRIQNFRSWSPWMVPDPSKACVGMEDFCFAGDDLWSMSDDALVALAADELEQLRLAPSSKVARGYALSDPSREQAIVAALQAANHGPMADEAVPDVVAAVLAVTLREVRRLRGQGW